MSETIYDRAVRLKEVLEARCTAPQSDNEKTEYFQIRRALMDDPQIAEHVPEFVKKCHRLDDFWHIVKQYKTWAERKGFVSNAFTPFLTFLESLGAASGPGFALDREAYLSKLVQFLMAGGWEREVAVLYAGRVSFVDVTSDGWAGVTQWSLHIGLPLPYYSKITEADRRECESRITRTAHELPRTSDDWIAATTIAVEIEAQQNWREIALKWLQGEGINNQGRVRSDNMPSRQEDGLLFRSQPEVLLYRALKSLGVVFAPLPVYLRGGSSYQRIEPDFIVFRQGATMVVEVDGDGFHFESPADADQRTRLFKAEGAHIERVKASECDTPEKAAACAKRLIADFDRWRAAIR
jgi:hypothetical protein